MKFIYLHGFASGPGSQKARYFRDRFRENGIELLVPDLAEGDFENLTVSGQLAVVERAAAGETSALIGSSMGGYVAAIYAARHKEVQRVVLMAPAFGFGRRWPEALGPETMEEWKRSGFLELYHYGTQANRGISYRLVEDASTYEDYPDVTQPALVFHGTHDEVVPAQFSRHFASNRPNVHLEILDSGHELLNVLEPMWEQACPFLLR
ncbi:MAG: alpha/beta fold hydrolase [Acidobacteria bacterium]|nr:alpha/beta fold hydrolase [Acidobacteriota bacterium]